MPGEFRTSPNWIGSPDDRPETAVFVPPPADEMKAALDDSERFVDVSLPTPARRGLVPPGFLQTKHHS